MTVKKFPVVYDHGLTEFGKVAVNLTTGNLQLLVTDYVQLDVGHDFILQRGYDSRRIRPNQPLGERWLLNFGGQLFRIGKKLRIFRENYHREKFYWEEGRWLNERRQPLACQLLEGREGWTLRDIRQHTVYQYDHQGRLRSLIRQDGQVLSIDYNGQAMERIHLASGQELRLGYQKNKLHMLTDVLGRVLSYDYEGELLQRVTYPNHGHADYTYDASGLLLTCRDRNGALVMQNRYDTEKRLIRRQLGQDAAWIYEYREQDRQTAVFREGGGSCIVYHWNNRKQIVKISYEDGTEQQYRYDKNGSCIYEQDRLGREAWRAYDDNGMLVQETCPDGVVRSFTYDAFGQMLLSQDSSGKEIRFHWSPQGWLLRRDTRIGEKSWQRETWVYDRMGRALEYVRGKGRTRWLYEGEAPVPKVLELPDGGKIHFRYDKVWRLLVIASALGERSFGYNPLDLIVSDTDALGNRQSRSYDLQGRLLHEGGGMGAERRFQVDVLGRKIREDGPQQELCRWTYDAFGRLVMMSRADAHKKQILRWHYDQNDRCILYSPAQGKSEQRSYDAAGRLLTRQREGVFWQYSYDAGDHLLTIHQQDELVHTWQYGTDGRLTCEQGRCQLQEDEGRCQTLFRYDAAGRLTERRHGYAVQDGKVLYQLERFLYDEEGHCTEERRWLDGQDAQSASGKVLLIRYRYDAAGRLQAAGDNLGARAVFSYNSLNQLVREKFLILPEVTYLLQYTYDAAGQLQAADLKLDYQAKGEVWRHHAMKPNEARGARPFQLPPAELDDTAVIQQRNAAGWPMRVLRDGQEWHYGYDAQGHVTTFSDGARYGWYRLDVWGRIQEAHSLGGGVLYFAYDLAGNIRVSMDSNRTTYAYTFDETNALLDGQGAGLDILAALSRGQAAGSSRQQACIRAWAGQPRHSGIQQPMDFYTYICCRKQQYADPVGYIRRKMR